MNRGVIMIIVDLDKDSNGIRAILDQLVVPPIDNFTVIYTARGEAAERDIAGFLNANTTTEDEIHE